MESNPLPSAAQGKNAHGRGAQADDGPYRTNTDMFELDTPKQRNIGYIYIYIL